MTGTENVLSACRRHGVRPLIYTSSPSVVFTGHDLEGVDESMPYAEHYDAAYPATKAIAEKLVLRARLRPGHDLDPPAPDLGAGRQQHLAQDHRASSGPEAHRIGNRNPLIDLTYIDNAALADVLAGDRLEPGSPIAGKSYFIAQGQPIPLCDMVDRFLAAANLPPVERTIPASSPWRSGECLRPFIRFPDRLGAPHDAVPRPRALDRPLV